MRGRPPKPTETKRNAGNRRKEKLPDPVTVAGRGTIPPPEHLTETARDIWREVEPELANAGVTDAVDRYALEIFCTAVAITRQAVEAVNAAGGQMTVTQPSGRVAPSPHFAVWKDATATARQYAEQLGLTPSARARLGVAGKQGASIEDLDLEIGVAPRFRVVDGGA